MLLCYITGRRQFPGSAAEQERLLLKTIAECAAAGVDYIQLREKDLSVRQLEALAAKAMAAIPAGSAARLLINSRMDVALACGAHGVHLPAQDIMAGDARVIFRRAGVASAVIGVSAHSVEEVAAAEVQGADFAILAPVFEKNGRANPQGLDDLRRACRRPGAKTPSMPVMALGGITLENAVVCLQAGAAGIAGIRLFQQEDPRETVRRLRAISRELQR